LEFLYKSHLVVLSGNFKKCSFQSALPEEAGGGHSDSGTFILLFSCIIFIHFTSSDVAHVMLVRHHHNRSRGSRRVHLRLLLLLHHYLLQLLHRHLTQMLLLLPNNGSAVTVLKLLVPFDGVGRVGVKVAAVAREDKLEVGCIYVVFKT
jgi:hypothetical protein